MVNLLLVLECNEDGSVVVWDLAAQQEVARLPSLAASVSCLRWSKAGDKLAIGLGDFADHGTAALLVWSPLENAFSQTPLDKAVAAVAWLPEDAAVLVSDWQGEAQLCRLGDVASPQRVSLGPDAKTIVEAAHWSADCPLLPAWLAGQWVVRAE